jgi:hypothetical protein
MREQTDEYNEQFPTEEFDRKTLMMLNSVCKGIEVPTDEESKAAVSAHHGDGGWMQLSNEAASVEPLRNPSGH